MFDIFSRPFVYARPESRRGGFLSALLATCCISMLAMGVVAAGEPTYLLRQPALSADHLVFVYAGDLWVTDRNGNEPRRLTSDPADEHSPLISPDGTQVAFASAANGNADVYVIPLAGGQPTRLTWHPGDDVPVSWAAGGREIAFVSARETDHGRSGQLYHVAAGGGAPRQVMAARFYRGTYDPSGRYLAYIAHGSGYNGLFGGTAGWKGYRGGTTPTIRIFDLESHTITKIPGERVTDFNPLWLDGALYFLSDREDRTFNLYRYDPQDAALTRLTARTDWDIRAAAGNGDDIVYEAGGRLHRFNLKDGSTTALPIEIHTDLPQRAPQWKTVTDQIQGIAVSPSGQRALITARGEVFTVPVKDGSVRNLTMSGAAREYPALWSPAGDQIAWIVESPAGQKLVVGPQTGIGERREYDLGPHFYELKAWHAATGRLIYSDNHLGLYGLDLNSGRHTKLAINARRQGFDVAFSPDGGWLAYTVERPNFFSDLMLYRFSDGHHTAVSDGDVDAASPAFSRDGKYLYFAASTNSGPLQVGLNMTSQERPYRAGLYAAVLAAGSPSPVAPQGGDEQPDSNKADDKEEKGKNGGRGNNKEGAAEKVPEVVIDLDGLRDRLVALPVGENNYSRLQAAEDGNLFYLQSPQPGASNPPPDQDPAADIRLLRFDFESRKAAVSLTGVVDFALTADGKKLLIQQPGGKLAIADAGKELKLEAIDTTGLKMQVEPRLEWRQIFDEAWRMEGEYFYAANLHGLDWDAVYRKYSPLVAHVGRREDLNALIVEMIAELGVGHNRIGGGDIARVNSTPSGLLGANFTLADGRYRLAKIYRGNHWNPALRAPLALPGNTAVEGEYLLAVNGRPLTAADNLFEQLANTIDQQVVLEVGGRADGRGSHRITVQPIADERELRLWSWIEDNRRQVAAATGDQVGYIYLPNTAGAGYTFFNRMFFAQVDKKALIIDERSNGGGQAANYITEVLSRRHLSGWLDRDGLPYNTPAGAVYGPKLMLIDQDAGSGGDYLPYSFRQLGIGKLLGTRTWGGLIGIFANPQLIDGGTLTVPFFRFYDAAGNWSVENEGVAPDIEVELEPLAANEGRDTQIEAAIAEIKAELAAFRDPIPRTPPPLPEELQGWPTAAPAAADR